MIEFVVRIDVFLFTSLLLLQATINILVPPDKLPTLLVDDASKCATLPPPPPFQPPVYDMELKASVSGEPVIVDEDHVKIAVDISFTSMPPTLPGAQIDLIPESLVCQPYTLEFSALTPASQGRVPSSYSAMHAILDGLANLSFLLFFRVTVDIQHCGRGGTLR